MSRRARGFTLLELLVALFIAALMFAMGYGAIQQGLNSHETLKAQQAHLLELQTAVRLLEQDFAQLAPRPVRQAVGSEPAQPALQGGLPGTQPIVALTRDGWANPAGLQRPGLQRVAYFLENGTLRREYWNVLDPTLASTTARRELLKHVKTFSIRYLDVNRQWQEQWPPATSTVMIGSSLELMLRERPLAVEITLDTEDWGKIVRIIEIAA
ncbi:MAG TPA: type II secretion system minor pseudopilin GspJ [Steroidobacteraceae bacterium]|jgi:general secretion pathway protein J|nr:type II secretion system minor pseudopilin GspJ [Steroidobacteraceae bacterium]